MEKNPVNAAIENFFETLLKGFIPEDLLVDAEEFKKQENKFTVEALQRMGAKRKDVLVQGKPFVSLSW